MKALASLILAAAICLLASTSGAGDVTGRVVNDAGEPVEQAIVFVKDGPVDEAGADAEPAIMDQIDKHFVPHVLPVVVGTPVRFPNHDQIHHHVFSFSRLKSFDLPLYRDEEPPPVVFDRTGAVRVGCNIHDWMSGVILVLPTRYFAATDASGAFTIPGVPAGAHTIVVWHERSARKVDETEQVVDVGAGPVTGLSFTLPLQATTQRAAETGRDYR
jgi:plastocyanin